MAPSRSLAIVVGLRHFATISSCRERRSSGATQGSLAGPPSSARNSTEGLLCFRRRFLKSAFQPGCQSNFTLGLLSVRIATFDSNDSSGNEVRSPRGQVKGRSANFLREEEFRPQRLKEIAADFQRDFANYVPERRSEEHSQARIRRPIVCISLFMFREDFQAHSADLWLQTLAASDLSSSESYLPALSRI